MKTVAWVQDMKTPLTQQQLAESTQKTQPVLYSVPPLPTERSEFTVLLLKIHKTTVFAREQRSHALQFQFPVRADPDMKNVSLQAISLDNQQLQAQL